MRTINIVLKEFIYILNHNVFKIKQNKKFKPLVINSYLITIEVAIKILERILIHS
jgi:hypothetical protein